MRSYAILALAILLGLAVLAPAPVVVAHPARRAAASAPHGDPVRGAKLYQACTGCHSLDQNDVGPRHRGVVGRRAGSLSDFAYSPALRTAGFGWTPALLDRWLTNPQRLVPGARMYFSVAKPQDRADIIAYLSRQK